MAIDYQSAFNSGELSGRMNGRNSLEVYKNGCSRLENFYVLPQGGVERRTGTEFIGETKNGGRAKMVPFKFSSTQSYTVEIGDGYISVWNGSTRIDVTDSSPYSDAELDDLEFDQRFDILYIQSPSKNIYELRRETLDPTFSIQEIEYDYPPLLEENETDITMSPSATEGLITLTSSQDFFNPNHVGAYMGFEVPRDIDNATISGSFTATDISDPLYVSNSNWDFSTTGSWRGRVIIQRSMDNKETWEDYVVVGDTSDVSTSPDGRSNFAYPSVGQEGVGTWVRVQFIDKDGTISYQLQTDSPWKTLVKITGYTDAQNVTCEVLDSFQDIPDDYIDWSTSTNYVKGDKRKIDGGISYSSTNVNLESIDSELGNIVGSDFDGSSFWFVTDSGSAQKIWQVDSTLSSVIGVPFDISSDWSSASDIALYSNEIYISGKNTFPNIKRYDLNGVYLSTDYSISNSSFTFNGLGYYNNHFYIGMTSGASSPPERINKYTTSFSFTSISSGENSEDSTGYKSRIYSLDADNSLIVTYNESLLALSSQDVSGQASSPKGIAFDGVNMWVFGDNGGVMSGYKYDFVSQTSYYECTTDHLSSVFSTEYDDGYWAIRTPGMTTWKEGAYSDHRGWPRAITFHEDRFWLAGSDFEPSTIYASVSGDYYNFATGNTSADSIKRIPDNPELAQWLVGRKRMILGTEGGAIVVKAVDERELIDASNIVTASQAVFGASTVPAIEANDVVVYAERSNKKLRELVYNRDEENFRSADMNILNNEILQGGVKELFLQQQPDQIVWAIDGNGDAACLTYERVQEVVGWSRFITDGEIQSACRLPSGASEDEVWMCVKRNGKYLIERTKSRSDASWFVDSGVEAITGLDHLEGLTVRCVVDGEDDGTYTVSGGAITPATSGTDYLVGLDYDSILRTMPIEPGLVNRLPNSRVKGSVKAIAEFYPTRGGFIGEKGKDLEGITLGDGTTPAQVSGEKKFPIKSDWTREKIIEIKQSLPYPMVVLSLAVWTEVRGG